MMNQKVVTALGAGEIVYELSDGTFLVQFDHGGGHIFLGSELFRKGVQQSQPATPQQERQWRLLHKLRDIGTSL